MNTPTPCSFRYFWACLPWSRATFHTLSPAAVSDLASHICSPDRAVLELLHTLDWPPVLQQLGNLESQDEEVKQQAREWAVQIIFLTLKAAMLMPPSELPSW